MPHVYSLHTPGVPTCTAKSARPSSFGPDDFAPPVDPDLMDREWYHGQDYYPHSALHAHAHSRLSPAADVLTAVAFSYPPHTESASEALTGMSTSSCCLSLSLSSAQCPRTSFSAHAARRGSCWHCLCPVQPGMRSLPSRHLASRFAIARDRRARGAPTHHLPHDRVALTPRIYQPALDAKLHADAETKARCTLLLTAP